MKVFVTHAVANEQLAQRLVRLLELGMGIGDHFCSTTPGSIPAGVDDIMYILGNLSDTDLVVGLLSRSYLSSLFCHGEGCVARVHQILNKATFFPLIVPPATHRDLKGSLMGMQVAGIDTQQGLDELRTRAIIGNATPPDDATWQRERDAFLVDAKPLLEREAALALLEKITLQDVYLHNDPTAGFKLKLRMVFRNDTGVPIEIQTATWDDNPTLIWQHHNPIFQIENLAAGGWQKDAWHPEPNPTPAKPPAYAVQPHHAFRTWIGLHPNRFTEVELRRLLVGQNVGVIHIPVKMNGHIVEYVEKF